MKKSLLISEADNIAALLENDRVVEFFVNRGELLLGDVYTATVENILPGIDAGKAARGQQHFTKYCARSVPGFFHPCSSLDATYASEPGVRCVVFPFIVTSSTPVWSITISSCTW